MPDDNKSSNKNDAFFPEEHQRVDSNKSSDTKEDSKLEAPPIPPSARKNKVVQPDPDSGKAKDRLVSDAHAADHTPSPPPNTTTLPGDIPATASKPSGSTVPVENSANQASTVTSTLPPKEHLDSLDPGEKALPPSNQGANKRVITILVTALVLALIIGMALVAL